MSMNASRLHAGNEDILALIIHLCFIIDSSV